jgi:Family of unknown function (DUF6519)
MKADISADTFRPTEHFAAVVLGQGQVLVDSTVNEQEQIARFRHDVTTGDVLGPSGTPKSGGGFQVTVSPDGTDLLVSAGRMYVDGMLCVNEPQVVQATGRSGSTAEVDIGAPDGRPLAPGHWIDLTTAGGTERVVVSAREGRVLTFATAVPGLADGSPAELRRVTSFRSQPDRFPRNPFDAGDPDHVTAGAYRVELDVWLRHLTPVERPAIREVAIGDAESATRLKVVWQLRLVAAGGVGGGSCSTGVPPAPGALLASTVPGPPADEACVLPDEAGYRGLENQLYRVEVHEVSSARITLKWQRDNASIASRVLTLGTTLQLEDMHRDDERGFASAPFVEVTDEALELEQSVGDLLAVVTPDKVHRTVTVAAPPTLARRDRGAIARRWDGRIDVDVPGAGAGNPVPLENGVQVALAPGELRPGDYWLIPARTSNSAGGGTITWPTGDDGTPLAQPPHGVRHSATPLALVDTDGTRFIAGAVRECRSLFPPLTAITAADVSVDGTACGIEGATTVQEAVDALCARASTGGVCTVSAVPGAGWESVFDAVPDGADAQVCFPVGEYPVDGPVQISGKGHLVVHGAGAGSILRASGSDPVLVFVRCASVRIEALTVAGERDDKPKKGLGASLTFDSCGEVTVRDCRVSCAPDATRLRACIRTTGGSVLIESTRFGVGDRQCGLVAIDATSVVVRGNAFRIVARQSGPGGRESFSPAEKLLARRLLFSELGTKATAGGSRVAVSVGGRPMTFATTPTVSSTWGTLLEASYPSMRHFRKSVDKVLRNAFSENPAEEVRPLASFLVNRVVSRRIAVMSQAIVVAGRVADRVVVDGNMIDAAVQGVHVGASHEDQPRVGSVDRVGSVTVSDNTIHVVVPPEGARGRHAIFVGNADRLRITGNDLSYAGEAEGDRIRTEGIRVYGFIGRAMTLRDNVVDSFPGGIGLHLLAEEKKKDKDEERLARSRMWAVEDNLILGASPEITLEGPLKGAVKLRGNRPGPADN